MNHLVGLAEGRGVIAQRGVRFANWLGDPASPVLTLTRHRIGADLKVLVGGGWLFGSTIAVAPGGGGNTVSAQTSRCYWPGGVRQGFSISAR